MGGKDGSPGAGTFTPLRGVVAFVSVTAFLVIFSGWSAYFDRHWAGLLGFPIACAVAGLMVVIGGLIIDRAEQADKERE